ncbi:hypothetical protein [Bradyrhizobium monzae]|uniref:hypothetical protein n=1 Tax=Bradyrhizobium sp. Oc8 TaxID=2876780 RepID=UPI001F24874D|nr:hypothetical protein [Bradyrhizobium sp. Oc8]
MRLGRIAIVTLAIAAGSVTLLGNERALLTAGAPVVSTAGAVIGRPLTPLSYAGVARRTTRRAVVAGAAVGAAAAAPVVVAPACVQRVDTYGRVYTVCP